MSCASQRSSSITSDGAGPTGAGAARDEGWPLTPTEAAQDIVDAEALFPSSLGELRIVPLAPAQRSDEVITTVFDVRHEQTTIGRLHVSYVGNGAFAVTEIERCAA